jgi:dodecin
MPEKTYKIIEVVGVSEESIQHAIRNALMKASQTLRNLDWFEVEQIRGAVRNGPARISDAGKDRVSARRRCCRLSLSAAIGFASSGRPRGVTFEARTTANRVNSRRHADIRIDFLKRCRNYRYAISR